MVTTPSTDGYNIKASQFRRTRAGLASSYALQGTLKVGHLGDSTGRGAPHATAYKDSPLMVVKSFLAKSGYVGRGTGLVPCFMNYAASDPRITWYNGQQVYSMFSNLTVNWTTTNGVVFSTRNTGEVGTVSVVWYADTSAPFDVQIDGGPRMRINPTGTKTMRFATFKGLANTTHETIVWPSAAGSGPFVLGFELRADTAYGIDTYNACISGAKTDSLASTDWTHVTSTVSSKTAGWGADLVIITCSTNDMGNGTDPVVFKNNMQMAIDSLRANDTDILLTTGNVHRTGDFTAYTAALYDLAGTNDLPLVDTQERWGSWEEANSYGQMHDDAHPSVTGYGDLGRALFNVLPL